MCDILIRNRTMNKLLVLDRYTNGHTAAITLQSHTELINEQTELVFCGSHRKIIEQLPYTKCYAVLPLYNTSIGVINEVVNLIGDLDRSGKRIQVLKRCVVPITHCLVTNQNVCDLQSIKRVISHEKALDQCSEFLDSLNIQECHRIKHNSTADAVKVLSEDTDSDDIAAIASRTAAEAYGLKVLCDDIQNQRDNYTHFYLIKCRSV